MSMINITIVLLLILLLLIILVSVIKKLQPKKIFLILAVATISYFLLGFLMHATGIIE